LPYVRSPDWRASSSHASASSNSVCLACASGIRATISRHARAYSINLAGSSTISGFRRLTGPEIGHDDLGQAIGIALARQAQVDDLGHEDFRRGIRRGNSPAPHRPCRRQPAWPGCVQVQLLTFGIRAFDNEAPLWNVQRVPEFVFRSNTARTSRPRTCEHCNAKK
jgi:hypothetical protein